MILLRMALEVVVAVLFVAGTGGGGGGGGGGASGVSGGVLHTAASSRPNRRARLHNFDDFLENFQPENRIMRTKIIRTLSGTSDDEDLQLDAGSGSEVTGSARRNIYIYNSGDPTKSCCHLGRLAGESGFHCHSHVYKARYRMRVENKIPSIRKFYNNGNKNNNKSGGGGVGGGDGGSEGGGRVNRGIGGSTSWTNQTPVNPILYNFQSCVSRRPQDFHRCCYVAKIRRRQIYRYHRHRHFTQGINSANNPLMDYFY